MNNCTLKIGLFIALAALLSACGTHNNRPPVAVDPSSQSNYDFHFRQSHQPARTSYSPSSRSANYHSARISAPRAPISRPMGRR